MIKPTIGRVVWFWCSGEEAEREGAQPRAALVTYVHDDYCVNLAVFDKEGDHFPHPAIELWQGPEQGERPRSLHCEWMPYQKGQAAKDTAPPMQLFARVTSLEQQVQTLVASLAELLSAKRPNTAVETPTSTLPAPSRMPTPPTPPIPPAIPSATD